MSERKTDEIKFRVEPSVKARWQEAADTAGESLSEFMREGADSRAQMAAWTLQNLTLGGGSFVTGVTSFTPNDGQPLQPHSLPPETETLEESQPSPQLSASSWKPFGADRVG
jgi:hypothetical protein